MHGAKSVIGEKYLQLVKGNRKDSLKIINLAIFYLYSFNSRTWKSRNGECGTTLISTLYYTEILKAILNQLQMHIKFLH